MNPAMEFDAVSVAYPHADAPVVRAASLRIAPGEKAALFGLNGSGKTTLLLAAAGIVPFTGTIIVDGLPVGKKNLGRIRERIGFLFNVPEDQILFPRVIDDVAWGLLRRGIPHREAYEKARTALDTLGIVTLAESSTFQLSHGQRQRVALAGAIVTNPAILLLDEPSSALDPRGRRALIHTLRPLGSAMLIATHDVDFAAEVCTTFILIENGKPLPCDSLPQVREKLLGADAAL